MSEKYPPEIRRRILGTPEQNATAEVREPPRGWRRVVIEDYDPAWPARFAAHAAGIEEALGDAVEALEHVGSTSVPGLAAKSIIDIDLTIGATDDESTYVPALEAIGYVLILREPWWHGHRMLVDEPQDVHLHVWPRGAAEPIRHRLFRDWLRTHPDDRERYAAEKRRLAGDPDYGMAKSDVIDQIFDRIFSS